MMNPYESIVPLKSMPGSIRYASAGEIPRDRMIQAFFDFSNPEPHSPDATGNHHCHSL
jgi:hypothetical protein